jgi:hypothetical protein
MTTASLPDHLRRKGRGNETRILGVSSPAFKDAHYAVSGATSLTGRSSLTI